MRQGLSDEEVIRYRKQYGNNIIDNKTKNTFVKLLLESLGDPIIRILLIALGIKTVLFIKNFDWYETVGIVIAIIIASFISTISEYGSEKAFNKLQELSSKINSKVIRNRIMQIISIDDVVVNDIVVLESGEMIPGDGIVIEGIIDVDEKVINGESHEQKRIINDNLYRGTVVTNGHALMKINKVGSKTMLGKVFQEVSEDSPVSPLRMRLTKLAGIISRIGYAGAFLIAISYLFSVIVIDNNFDMGMIRLTVINFPLLLKYILYALTLSVTVIVVAVPEGLPMMITLVLSSNMKKMIKKNVLVRKMVGIETAGSMNILFTDKTGTITKGNLEVIGLLDGMGNYCYNFHEFERFPKLLEKVKLVSIYNNDAIYNGTLVVGGNATDRAICNIFKEKRSDLVKIIDTVPFKSENKYSISVIDNGNRLKLVKGAYETIINNCSYYYDYNGEMVRIKSLDKILDNANKMTDLGYRVIAIATSTNYLELKSLRNLCLIGLLFIRDDVREEARDAVTTIKNAHIDITMVTGDSKNTAVNIAREVGIVTSDNDLVLSSLEFNCLSDDEVLKIIHRLKVLYRSKPTDKSRLVRLSQKLDLVVGMTGDGVNDAAALRTADVGFSMGSGTEVAKEASDIVILDDNINSIVSAISFGRTIFKSIRKFIIFQLTVNLCALSISLIGPFIGVSSPITVIQMLWINMVMDTLAGIAFSYEVPLKEYMLEYPKKKHESIINRYMFNEILITGIYTSLLCVLFLKLPMISQVYRSDLSLLTAFFGLFIFTSLFNSFNARTNRLNIFAYLKNNKIFVLVILFVAVIQIYLIYFGNTMFRTVPLSMKEFILMLLLSLSVIPFDFLRKWLYKLRGNREYV